ncbi:uncharacterized protein LOC135213900 [Macrobrachium nipponense]|uniref:uncharacterized protein LOC135213900 n=1 Tax=Macrobrachium nipponense TaxID=159736 RepID=UPI0030C886D8
MCEPDLLKASNVCTCRKAILLAEDGFIHNSLKGDELPADFGVEGNGNLVLYYNRKNSCIERHSIAMWPSLNKTQRVHLCNTTIAMEWTIAGLYICRYIQRKLYDRIHSASVSPGRGGVAQDAVEIARDVVDLMRDYDDAMIPEVDELRELLSEPHIRVSTLGSQCFCNLPSTALWIDGCFQSSGDPYFMVQVTPVRHKLAAVWVLSDQLLT